MITSPREYNFPEGEILLIDKPLGWTSFDVVNKIRNNIRRYLGVKKIKVGHAGTLDPLATGLLVICTGRATKKIETLQILDKEYTGTFFLGATTPSFDKETDINQTYPIEHIDEDRICKAAASFTGTIEQVPPLFSAVKFEGTRAYELARKKQNVTLQARKINISEFSITKIQMPEIDFRVRCSKGTYIRALARDLGITLQSGAYLSSLCRTRIGNYKLSDAISVYTLEQQLIASHNSSEK